MKKILNTLTKNVIQQLYPDSSDRDGPYNRHRDGLWVTTTFVWLMSTISPAATAICPPIVPGITSASGAEPPSRPHSSRARRESDEGSGWIDERYGRIISPVDNVEVILKIVYSWYYRLWVFKVLLCFKGVKYSIFYLQGLVYCYFTLQDSFINLRGNYNLRGDFLFCNIVTSTYNTFFENLTKY